MKQTLNLRTGVTLAMTPALQQAIRLLQMSSLDLQTEIREALESNLMLEAEEATAGDHPDDVETHEAEVEAPVERAVEVTSEAVIPEEMPVDADWSDIYDGAAPTSGSTGDSDLHDYLQANLHVTAGLREHLNWQASIAPFDETDTEIALTLIDAINEDGYLEDWAGIRERLCTHPGIGVERMERVLAAVQDFDPSGVAARDLPECLRLQLRQLPEGQPARANALALLQAPMALIAQRDVPGLASATGVDADAIAAALTLIASLQPHPGRPYQISENNYVAPDVYVTKREGRWRVTLNPEHTPRLRVNAYYQGMIRRADTSRDQLTLKAHLQEARCFISSLRARNETLLRVAQCIVQEQRAFLEYGEEAMRPLVLRDISEQLGVHESTVSRATANKYLLTPRGLFELKYFFSSHLQTTQGGTCSATAIQAMIKRLITEENPVRPLSDSTLSEMLLNDGIQVARRTVAKYREALRIPPSHERRPVA